MGGCTDGDMDEKLSGWEVTHESLMVTSKWSQTAMEAQMNSDMHE